MFKDTTEYDFPQGKYLDSLKIYWEDGEEPNWMAKVEACNLLRVAINRVECDFSINVILYAITLGKKIEISIEHDFWSRLAYCDTLFYADMEPPDPSCYGVTALEILKSRKFSIVFNEIKRHGFVRTFVSRWNQKEVPDGYIYAIKSIGINRVKIGYSENPKKRLQQLSTGSSVPLEMWGFTSANPTEEKELHSLFSEYRVNGEWFELDGPVVDWAMSIKGKF